MRKKLKEECYITMGQSPKGDTYNFENMGTPFLQGRRTFGRMYPNVDTWTTNPIRIAKKDSVLMSVRAPVGDMNIANRILCIGRGLCSLEMKNGNNIYLYYLLQNNIDKLKRKSSGTVFDSVNSIDIENLELDFHNEDQQKKIGRTLFNIDKKIELNNEIIDNFQKLSQELYIRWFVDFEFSDEDGNPYKSSGGKMTDSELGEIPQGWEVKKLNDFFPVVTGKKDANASSPDGIYPFFTCGQGVSSINNYSFDGDAILLTGNGDFNVKFYRGKFDAYQRTYVLIPEEKKILSFLYWTIFINLDKITSGQRGSVIKFITKGSIENFKIPFKKELEVFDIFQTLLTNIEFKVKENESFAKLRDKLLPKLLSGEINLDRIEVGD